MTLIEVLVGIVVLALVMVAVAAISISGVIQIGRDSQERQAAATTAQWASLVFARDVQGAVAVVDECSPGVGEHLVTIQASDSFRKVEYRIRSSTSGFELLRTVCGVDGSSRTIVDELTSSPEVECEQTDGSMGPCVPPTAPRRMMLRVGRSADATVELDGTRRVTDGNSTQPPLEVPSFVSLGGDTPFEAGGNSQLQVIGNALINRPASGPTAVRLTGGGGSPADPDAYRLRVSGDFELQSGALCQNCATHSDKQPGTYQTRLPDPLRFLPAPDTSSLPQRSDCPVQGGVRVCQPGIYVDEFPPSGGGSGVKDYELRPGIYVLRDGMKVTNGSITGSGVLIYNEIGNVKITGAALDVTPPTSGTYSGILFFQARSNTSQFEIVGNAALASLAGTIYAPMSSGVVLGGGGGSLYVGRVIGQNLETSGGGTVVVDGS